MKRITPVFVALFLVFVLAACNKKDVTENAPPPPVSKPVGEPTAIGMPTNEAAVQKTIGVEGGTVESEDGSISINIPSGALSSAQLVSIQSIMNHNPLGVGKAYRLEPHGITFNKPVTIEFSIDESSADNVLGIAFQDSNNVWQARAAVVDRVNMKAKITTTHFSDWSLFETLYLTATAKSVKVNGSVGLEVLTTDHLLALMSLTEDIPMGKKLYLPATYIKNWELAGAGNLDAAGAKGTYKAPGEVPDAPNPVAVSVNIDLGQNGRYILVKHIVIYDEQGEIEVRVAGGPWVKKIASPAVKVQEGLYAVGDVDGDTEGSHVLIMWEGGIGDHSYKSPDVNLGTYVHYLIDGGDNYVSHYMNEEDELERSGGSVTITSMGEEDGFITGTFKASPDGHGFNLKSRTSLEGKFRVKKGW